MKKAAAGCFAVACVIAVLVAILASIGGLRQEKLLQLPPLTLQELDRLSRDAQKPEVPAKEAVSALNPTDESAAEDASEGPTSAANLPRRLNRTATDEQRLAIYTLGRTPKSRIAALIGTGPVGTFIDAVGVAAGIPEGASANLGEMHLIRGNLAEARSCYTEFVRKSHNAPMLRAAYAHLAWLEEDPELAAHYMELACSGGDIYPLVLSEELARATGSKELADYYGALFEKRAKAVTGESQ